jgi:hypothetical protein
MGKKRATKAASGGGGGGENIQQRNKNVTLTKKKEDEKEENTLKDSTLDLVEGILSPGIQPKIVRALYWTLGFILLLMGCFLYADPYNIHVYIMLGLTLCLLASLLW